jgi:glyoxylase-like metal-dependent hydrolase (beta-lactamase superfamily II)
MKVETLIVGPLDVGCYILTDEKNEPRTNEVQGESIVIDPGGDADKIINFLKTHNLQPRYLVNTHGHGDHIGANKALKERFPDIKICIHREDAECLSNPFKNLSALGGFQSKEYILKSPPADIALTEGVKLTLGKIVLEVIHTPGHTPGGICLLSRSEDNQPDVLFSGDSLFQGSIGRTDFPGGNHHALIKSLKEKILTLKENTVVYPGHGPTTTVGREKKNNPYLSD